MAESYDILSEDSYTPPENAVPEVPAPNPVPSGNRFDTSTESYAGGHPAAKLATWSVLEAKRIRREKHGTD